MWLPDDPRRKMKAVVSRQELDVLDMRAALDGPLPRANSHKSPCAWAIVGFKIATALDLIEAGSGALPGFQYDLDHLVRQFRERRCTHLPMMQHTSVFPRLLRCEDAVQFLA